MNFLAASQSYSKVKYLSWSINQDTEVTFINPQATVLAGQPKLFQSPRARCLIHSFTFIFTRNFPYSTA